MEGQIVPFHKRGLVWAAACAAVAFSAIEFYILYLKEPGPWNTQHLWGEFTLAVIPNLIAGALTFIAVDFVIERKDARERYIGAMKSIRIAAKDMHRPLTEEQVQDLMVTTVEAISTLYFGKSKPPCSGKPFGDKSCTNCPRTPQPANADGSCIKCNEIPECWSVKKATD
jgi:uncharacterized membrane protein